MRKFSDVSSPFDFLSSNSKDCVCPFCVGDLTLASFVKSSVSSKSKFENCHVDSKSFMSSLNDLRTSVKVNRESNERQQQQQTDQSSKKKTNAKRASSIVNGKPTTTTTMNDTSKIGPSRVRLWTTDEIGSKKPATNDQLFQSTSTMNFSTTTMSNNKSPSNTMIFGKNLSVKTKKTTTTTPIVLASNSNRNKKTYSRLSSDSDALDSPTGHNNNYWNQVFENLKLNPNLSTLFYQKQLIESSGNSGSNTRREATNNAKPNPRGHHYEQRQSHKRVEQRGENSKKLWQSSEDANADELPMPPPVTPV